MCFFEYKKEYKYEETISSEITDKPRLDKSSKKENYESP